MEVKEILNPKYLLTGLGVIFVILSLGNFIAAEGSAEAAWGDDYTDRDVFYEQAWGMNSMPMAVMAIVAGMLVTGRQQAILAIAAAGAMMVSFAILYPAGTDVDYGFMTPVTMVVPSLLLVLVGVSGYLHLEDE
ncbi:MAG: hypothetical protein CMB67_00265 [Euryarchaeota archaeon]|nr:hypothetical protein [Euryarchaeota archaeon]|tara:strand:- start:94 stop:495 length:402 start_codon:yes stop_codon:yes gene_type:complete